MLNDDDSSFEFTMLTQEDQIKQQQDMQAQHHQHLQQQQHYQQMQYIQQLQYQQQQMLQQQQAQMMMGLDGDITSAKRPRSNLSWNVMFDLLVQYGQDHPDHNVPKSGVVTLIDGSKVNLGQWLKSQRKLRRNGKLQPQREAMLQSLIDKGTLYWDSDRKESNEDAWERNYHALVQYAKVHHHCNVPPGFVVIDGEHTIPLGSWLKDQHKTKKSGKLGTERSARFQVLIDQGLLGWDKDSVVSSRAIEWRKCYMALMEYGRTHQENYNVPYNYIVTAKDGSTLAVGKWLKEARIAYKAGKLNFDSLTLLQVLVNEGKLSWEDEDYLMQLAGQMRRLDEDMFDDLGSNPAKLLRLEEELSDAANVVASLQETQVVLSDFSEEIAHLV